MKPEKKKTIIRLSITTYICIMVVATEDVWTGILCEHVPDLIDSVLNSLECTFVNFATTLAIILGAIHLFSRVSRKRDYDICIFPILLSASWLLFYGKTWIPKETIFSELYYNTLFLIIIAIYALLVLIAVIKGNEEKPPHKDCKNGFSVDTPKDNLVNVGWVNCCKSLHSKLNNTDLSKECFTIGITGDWGSGKTTFLKELQTVLKKDFELIEFDLWICENSKQIIDSFFKRFIGKVKEVSEISESLSQYADALEDIDAFPWLSTILHKLTTSDKLSLQQLKECADKNVAASKRPYAVFIDDIDRLDKDEVLEVLRLIRITANFPNLVFIVAYDPRHVVKMLAENGIDNGYEYLRKMFQLEFPLPSFERYKLHEILNAELSRFIKVDSELKVLQNAMLTKDEKTKEYILPQYLLNFRDVKRFANAFALNYQQIENIDSAGDFDIVDLFWLEILHYSDRTVYNQLFTSRTEYLDARKSNGGLILYTLKPEKDLPKDINPESLRLLKYLFDNYDKRNSQLRYEANYTNYFCTRLPEHNISSRELIELLSGNISDEEHEIKLNEWYSGKPAKRTSLLRQIAKLNIRSLSESACKKYIFLIVWLVNKYSVEETRPIVCIQLTKAFYQASAVEELRSYLIELIENSFKSTELQLKWAYILSALYPICYYDSENQSERYDPEALISKEDIQSLLNKNLQVFIEAIGGVPKIEDLMYDTLLHRFMKATTVITSMEDGDEHSKFEQCLVYDMIKELYSANKSDKFSKFIGLSNSDEESGYDPDMFIENYKDSLFSIFGNKDDYQRFIKDCFDVSDEYITNHLVGLGFMNKKHTPATHITSSLLYKERPEIYYS